MTFRVERMSVLALVLGGLFADAVPARAQIRGLYPPGTYATNSGVIPEAGLTYENLFQLYSFDELKTPDGLPLFVHSSVGVALDENIFLWVSKKKILGGTYVVLADLIIDSISLTTVAFGALAGGAGLADSYFSPFTLAWKLKRADLQAGYSFVAPSGRFRPGADDNLGGGYWGNFVFGGQTLYLTSNKGTQLSAWEAYEFHTTQKTTDVHPGQTFDIDYSLMQVVPLDKDKHTLLQVGLVGYGQYQTSDNTGPGVNATIAANTHYQVNALGAAANVILPARKVNVGFKWFKEFSNNSTVEGQSLQILAVVTF